MKSVGPAMSTKASTTSAKARLKTLNHIRPRPSLEITDMTATPVMQAMMPTWYVQ